MDARTNDCGSTITLKTVDRLVGLLVVGILLLGGYSWWRATQRAIERRGMMGQMMGTMPGMDPIWYLFGTLIAVCVVLGVYAISREQLAQTLSTATSTSTDGTAEDHDSAESDGQHDFPSESIPGRTTEPSESTGSTVEKSSAVPFLPEDEQRVIEPILASPGLTQVELRGRSEFSKAKVSQTVSDLEDRGLIYREKQGRTYRVYPGELLKDHHQS